MTSSSENPAPLQFDLQRGRIQNLDGDPFLLLPLSVMGELCRSLSEDSLASFGYAVGTDMGKRLAQRLSTAQDASLSDVVAEAGAELALAGFGTLGAELWGKALVFTLKDATLSLGAVDHVDRGDPVVASLLSGVLMRAFSRDANVVPLGRSDGTARFVVCNPATSERVETWVEQGLSSGEVLARLNQGGDL